MKPTIFPVKGTRDFYPEEMGVRNWLRETARDVSSSFGYQEYDGPLLESLDLYIAKSGDELVKENFAFPDRSGEMITLRPELTPSLARMIAQRQKQLVFPLRWWSFGPFWRYERPQKGRTREFFQWNIDLMGADSPLADAELIAIGATFLSTVGLSPYEVKILVNNRKLLDQEFNRINIPGELRPAVFKLIDKRDKLAFPEWEAFALEIGLDQTEFNQLVDLLENHDLWKESDDLCSLFSYIESMGLSPWVSYAPHIIRGLDYYTGTVFEAWDSDGEFRAILGGGRYNDLVNVVGGNPVPGVGFAMGDVVMSLVLKKFSKVPLGLGNTSSQVLITIFDENYIPHSLKWSALLRNAGIKVVCYPEITKLSRQFKFGDKLGINFALVIGPDEIEKEIVTVKNLKTGDQVTVDNNQVLDFLLTKLT